MAQTLAQTRIPFQSMDMLNFLLEDRCNQMTTSYLLDTIILHTQFPLNIRYPIRMPFRGEEVQFVGG